MPVLNSQSYAAARAVPILFNTPTNPYEKSSYPKKILVKFSYPKKSRIENFKPKKILQSSRSGADPGFFLGGGAPLRNDVTDGEV